MFQQGAAHGGLREARWQREGDWTVDGGALHLEAGVWEAMQGVVCRDKGFGLDWEATNGWQAGWVQFQICLGTL